MNCKTCNFSLVEGQTSCPVCGTPVEGVSLNNNQNNNEGMKEVVLGSFNTENKTIIEENPTINLDPKENDIFGFNAVDPIVPEVSIQPEVKIEEPTMPEVSIQPEVKVEEPIMPEVSILPEVKIEEPIMPEVIVQPEAKFEEPISVVDPNENSLNMFPNNETNLEPNQNIATQQVESASIAPEDVKNLENSIMPDNGSPIQTPVADVAPAIEQQVKPLTMESPKPAKKGLGIIPMILIGLVIMVLAAAAGYFGYKKFFIIDQKASLDGYEYRISGKYKATIENNEKILIYEKINKTDSTWVMTIAGLDEEAKTFENVKTEKEAINDSISADYIVEKMDVKNISGQDVLIYEVKKDEEVGYILYTPNKDDKPIKSEITFPKPPRSEKAIEIFVNIAKTAVKK